ncbi:ABC transporter ATP-binding protein, partial [Cereibacter changlensis]
TAPPSAAQPAAKPEPRRTADALSFTERKRLEALPGLIARIEAEIAKLTELMSATDLFTRDPVKFRKATEAMAERQAQLQAAEEEWLALEEKAGA